MILALYVHKASHKRILLVFPQRISKQNYSFSGYKQVKTKYVSLTDLPVWLAWKCNFNSRPLDPRRRLNWSSASGLLSCSPDAPKTPSLPAPLPPAPAAGPGSASSPGERCGRPPRPYLGQDDFLQLLLGEVPHVGLQVRQQHRPHVLLVHLKQPQQHGDHPRLEQGWWEQAGGSSPRTVFSPGQTKEQRVTSVKGARSPAQKLSPELHTRSKCSSKFPNQREVLLLTPNYSRLNCLNHTPPCRSVSEILYHT